MLWTLINMLAPSLEGAYGAPSPETSQAPVRGPLRAVLLKGWTTIRIVQEGAMWVLESILKPSKKYNLAENLLLYYIYLYTFRHYVIYS